MKTLPLFDEADETLLVHPARTEPLFWLKEVRFLHSLDEDAELIREPITFRRGFNIIATSKNTGTTAGSIGHSVGKSLLMRLIRYCLGEPGFIEKAPRQAICDHFPHGYVVATFVVGGVDWYVARPIGLDSPSSQSFASPTTIESLCDRDHRQSFHNFTDLLHRRVIDPLPKINLPKARRELRWPDLIGWLAPDQKCAHKSHVTWRPSGAEPFQRGLTIEDNHVIVRTTMDLLTVEDSGLIEAHKTLLSDQGKLNRSIDLQRAVINTALTDLIADLPTQLQEFEGEILAGQALSYATEERRKAKNLLDDELGGDPLEKWRKDNNDLQQSIGSLQTKIEQQHTDIAVAQAELDSIDDGSHDEQLRSNADMGVFCHLFATKSKAMASGCPGQVERPKPDHNPYEERLKAERQTIIDNCQQRVRKFTKELDEKEALAETANQEYLDTFTKVEQRRQPLRRRIAKMNQIERDAKRFRKLCEELTTLQGKKTPLTKSITQSLETRRKADQRYKTKRQTLIACFNEALRRTTGSDDRGTIDINARGIFPSSEVGFQSAGEAVGTSTILAFDLACMLASMTGLGNHPRFLLDDSPRDADLEPPSYQLLLQSIADLEQLTPDTEPPFQYILTTTTRPNKNLAQAPYLRLTLDRIKDENMLLGVRF